MSLKGISLNGIVKRIKGLAHHHRMVKDFYRGFYSDYATAGTAKYPAVVLEDNQGGSLSLSTNEVPINFTLYFVDAVHVSQDAGGNETEVQSDQLEIAKDLFVMMDDPSFDDWKVSGNNQVDLLYQSGDDMVAGVKVDFTITSAYIKNRCAIPKEAPFLFENEFDNAFQ